MSRRQEDKIRGKKEKTRVSSRQGDTKCKVGTRTQRQKEDFPDKRVRRRQEDTKTRRQEGKGKEGEIIQVQGCQGDKEDTRKRLENERKREQKWTRVTAKATSGQAQGRGREDRCH